MIQKYIYFTWSYPIEYQPNPRKTCEKQVVSTHPEFRIVCSCHQKELYQEYFGGNVTPKNNYFKENIIIFGHFG